MSKRTLILIVIVFFLVLVGAVAVFFSSTKTPGTSGTGGGSNFFPFGQGSVPVQPNAPSTGGTEANPNTEAVRTNARLQELASPVAGFLSMQDKNAHTIRYVERTTGHIFDISVDTPTPPIRVSNTTAPKNADALWQPSGLNVLLRSLDADNQSIITFSGNLHSVASSTDSTLSGIFFPRNVLDVAVPPGGGKVAYLEASTGGSHLVVANPDGSKKTEIFTSPLSEWHLSWPATSTIAVLSKPSVLSNGLLYFLNTSTLKVTEVLDSIRGLTALPNQSLTKVLFSETVPSKFTTSVLDVKTGATALMPIGTLPEKCVWSQKTPTIAYCGVPISIPQANYPDMWYQGVIQFSDALWRLDTQSGNATLVSLLSDEAKMDIDVVKPALSPDENYLYFVNKNDSALWSLRLQTATSTTP